MLNKYKRIRSLQQEVKRKTSSSGIHMYFPFLIPHINYPQHITAKKLIKDETFVFPAFWEQPRMTEFVGKSDMMLHIYDIFFLLINKLCDLVKM